MTIGRTFGTADFDSFLAADVSLTRYNTVRSLRAMEGQFETRSFGRRTVAVRDLTREASYYNRVIGLDAETLPRLDEMIAWYHNEGRACHVSLTPERATPAVLERLAERGFGLVGMECFFAIHCDAIGPPDGSAPNRAGPTSHRWAACPRAVPSHPRRRSRRGGRGPRTPRRGPGCGASLLHRLVRR